MISYLLEILALLPMIVCQNSISLDIEHKLGSSGDFAPMGVIKLNAQGSADLQFKTMSSWSINEQVKAATSDALYCVRTKAQPYNVHSNDFVGGCLPACALVMSDLTDVLTLAMDLTRQYVIGLSVQSFGMNSQYTAPNAKSCKDINESNIGTELFNTTIRFVEPVEGPVPETQAYLQKIEREKQEKAQGDQGDNRSFLAKYWMYIVPVVVLVMLSGAMNPEAAQQQGR